jgi:hypothetical protein
MANRASPCVERSVAGRAQVERATIRVLASPTGADSNRILPRLMAWLRAWDAVRRAGVIERLRVSWNRGPRQVLGAPPHVSCNSIRVGPEQKG